MTTAERVRTDPRISRRRRAIERSRRRRGLITAGVVVALGAALWVAFWSPLLAVDEVVVVGGRHVTAADVARVAQLDASDNLLLASTSEITAKVEELAWVQSARVDRKLPGTIRVRIVERVPAAVLSLASGRWTLDAEGHVLTRGVADPDLPVLAGPRVSDLEEGTAVEEAEVQDALTTLRSLSPRIRGEVEALLAPTTERITLSLKDGTQVRFGAAEALRAKNEVLRTLLVDLRVNGGSGGYIDIRVPTSPAVSAAAQPESVVTTPPTPAPTP
ncbi:MAG: FtsQ-type POTRA domain-containing protein [Actinomycetota bacterium]|nr:FtsQ-type POTRA domain-containing protein [Actinomycetota bacterium]